LGPPGRPAAVPAEIRRAGGTGRPGKVGRMTRDSPATGLGAWLGSGSRRRWGSAAWPGGVTLAFLAPNKSPNKSRVFSKLSR
jgi:hypothetical protein